METNGPKNVQNRSENDRNSQKMARIGTYLAIFQEGKQHEWQKTLKWTTLGYNNFSEAILVPQRRFFAQKRPKKAEKGPDFSENGPRGSIFG